MHGTQPIDTLPPDQEELINKILCKEVDLTTLSSFELSFLDYFTGRKFTTFSIDQLELLNYLIQTMDDSDLNPEEKKFADDFIRTIPGMPQIPTEEEFAGMTEEEKMKWFSEMSPEDFAAF